MIREVTLRPGLTLLQDSRFFPLTQDSVLLADFAAGRGLRGRGLDLGAGQGFLSVLTAIRAPALRLEGIELVPEAAEIARENLLRAGLEIPVTAADLKDLPRSMHGQYDLCLCNPPYFRRGSGKEAHQPAVAAARAAGADIGEVAKAANQALKTGGKLYLCFPANRLAPLMCALSLRDFAPKALRPVRDMADKDASLLLVEAVKQGGEGMTVLPDLVLRERDGTKTEEYRRIYGE